MQKNVRVCVARHIDCKAFPREFVSVTTCICQDLLRTVKNMWPESEAGREVTTTAVCAEAAYMAHSRRSARCG